jgi:hypothetical protein
MKPLLVKSILLWLLLTVGLAIAMVFLPTGLDLQRARDEYIGYWDYRLVFFLVPWIGISVPAWALGTWFLIWLTSRKKPSPISDNEF